MKIEKIELKTGAILSLVADFYGTDLGLPITLTGSETLTVAVADSELVFRHRTGFSGTYHFAFNVPPDRLGAARAYLTGRGVALLPDANGETIFDFDFWDASALYFRDPAGNIAEFIARHELPTQSRGSNTPFTPDEIENISEIALPTGDVPTLAARLRDAVRVPAYRESSASFAPIGDADGLFIVVQEGRPWFPHTGIPAQILPITATVRNDREERFTVSNESSSSGDLVPYAVSPLA